MAGPLAGIAAAQAQAAQQKLPEQAVQQAKQGPSKFDEALNTQAENKAGHIRQNQSVSQVQASESVNKADVVRDAGQVEKTDRSRMNKIRTQALSETSKPRKAESATQTQQPSSKSTRSLANLMDGVEKGQASLDKLIGSALQGKKFSNAELLSLQASMYKYSQEMDLTSKIVEKTTSGLKDTLKTQV
ncbi:MAG: ATP-dependent helicase HrpB [Cystobacterineae bacterium]|nr:ATP-dependent helicase HrpB [Cystobacterineae bacterium]